MKRIPFIAISGVLLLSATAAFAAYDFTGPTQGPTGGNTPGVIWNVDGTSVTQPNAAINIGQLGKMHTIKGDIILSDTSAFRIDRDGASSFNMGNWGNGQKPFTLNVYGDVKLNSFFPGGPGRAGSMDAQQYCINGANCITAWPSGGGGGITSIVNGGGLTVTNPSGPTTTLSVIDNYVNTTGDTMSGNLIIGNSYNDNGLTILQYNQNGLLNALRAVATGTSQVAINGIGGLTGIMGSGNNYGGYFYSPNGIGGEFISDTWVPLMADSKGANYAGWFSNLTSSNSPYVKLAGGTDAIDASGTVIFRGGGSYVNINDQKKLCFDTPNTCIQSLFVPSALGFNGLKATTGFSIATNTASGIDGTILISSQADPFDTVGGSVANYGHGRWGLKVDNFGHMWAMIPEDTANLAGKTFEVGRFSKTGASTSLFSIKGDGRVVIGGATASAVDKLTVPGSVNLNSGVPSGIALKVNGAEAIWYDGTYFSWGYGGTANYFADNVGIGVTAPTYQLQLSQNSAAKPTSNVWTVASDLRLKDIHGDYTKGLADIAKLRPILYTYKKNNPYHFNSEELSVGAIAQEVQTVFPEAVKADAKGYLQLDTNSINWATINAIKELKTENDKLKAQNASLEWRLKVLEAKVDALLEK